MRKSQWKTTGSCNGAALHTPGRGRRAAAFELAIRSERDYQSGDQVTYYITGEKKKVSAVDNAKLLADAPEGERDENTAYYLNKLDELYRNFESFILPQK